MRQIIVAGIATIPSRINEVKRTIESLLPQVNRIYISLNGFVTCPRELYSFLNNNMFDIKITGGGDEQKFRSGCEYLDWHRALLENEEFIFLSCDDDLIYPPNYVEVIKQKLEQYEIITFHGRNFNSFPIQSYYKSAGSRYRCLDKVAQDVPVQFGGTGCMAFKPANFSVTLNDFPSKYMADVHLAIKAKKEGKRIMCISHEAGWIKYQPVSNTIYDRFRDDDGEQTDRVNEAFGVNAPRGTI